MGTIPKKTTFEEQNMSQKNTLPLWNLKDLYEGIKDPQIAKDFKEAETRSLAFAKKYEGKLSDLTGDALAEAIRTYESIEEIFGKLSTYGFLLFAADMSQTAHVQFYQTVKEKLTTFSTPLLFFTLEMNDLDEKDIAQKLKTSKALQKYEPWIKDVRVFKPYQCEKKIEKLLHEKNISSKANWTRLFEEEFSRLRFTISPRKKLSSSEVLHMLSDPDEKKRRAAATAFTEGLKSRIDLFALITNTLAKDKEIEDTWRGFKTPIQSRNVSNLVEDDVVETLMGVVKKAYPRLSHRYYKLKANWLGKEKLNYWDRNAPLPDHPDKKISWNEAKKIVLEAYHAFSPEMAKIAELFFKNNWIDAAPNQNKDSGAFSHGCVPSVHPYILMNFHGKLRDVMTLAHELGHGIHQYLARSQGYLLADTPLTVAETASVFGEMLTFQSLLRQAKDTKTKRFLLASKIEDMLSTVVRQVAFAEFERGVHTTRRDHELTVEELGQIWLKTQKESLGSAFQIDEKEYQYYWAYIPHFIHTPFYVYAYAFGDCLVNALYMTYEKGHPHFEILYKELLSTGGAKRYDALLKPFHLNPHDASFWEMGIGLIERFIDDLEKELKGS